LTYETVSSTALSPFGWILILYNHKIVHVKINSGFDITIYENS
jgi:hypothetical protein